MWASDDVLNLGRGDLVPQDVPHIGGIPIKALDPVRHIYSIYNLCIYDCLPRSPASFGVRGSAVSKAAARRTSGFSSPYMHHALRVPEPKRPRGGFEFGRSRPRACLIAGF